MSQAQNYTSERRKDPTQPHDYDVEALADTLLRVWEARPDEHEDEISSEAYTELVFRIAQIDRDWPGYLTDKWPRVSEIYSDLEISGQVKKVRMSNIADSHALKIRPAKSNKTANGWTSTRTSYEIHPAYREELFAALDLGDPAELAAAVEEAVTGDLRERVNKEQLGLREERETRSYTDARRESLDQLVGFFSPCSLTIDETGSPGAPGDPTATETGGEIGKEEEGREGERGRDGNRTGRMEARERGGKPGGDAEPAPNGCEVNRSENRQNRRSERSDSEKRGGSERSKRPRHEPDRAEFKTRGTREQRRFLDERVRMQAERLLFLHLLGHARKGTYGAGEDEHMEWNTVESEEMEKRMGAPYHSTYKVWHNSDLVEPFRGGHYVPPLDAVDEDPRARQFRIPQPVYEQFSALGDDSRRWWLHTEKPQRTSQPAPMGTDLSDENNNSFPPLIDGALRVLSDNELPIRIDEVREAIERQAEKEGKTPRAQKAGLQLALETIERQAEKVEGGITYIQNAYTPIFGGRLLFKNGGPQGMLGVVKARAFAEIYGLRNYDIVSCHTTGLIEVADKLAEVGVDVDVSPWEEYPGKYEAADQTGLPVILIKIVEHAIKYGAYLPASIAQAEAVFADTSIDPGQLQLVEAAKKYAEDPDEALRKLHDVFADMRRVVKKISKALLNEYWEKHKQPGGPAGYCMKNACGVPFRPDNFNEGHERQTKVMAWMLQGLEAAFVHSLTILSADSDAFSVVANEHDGLIIRKDTEGEEAFQETLNAAIGKARNRSGFTRADLVEKAFADEEDVEGLYAIGDEEEPEEEGEDEQPAVTETASNRPPRRNSDTETNAVEVPTTPWGVPMARAGPE